MRCNIMVSAKEVVIFNIWRAQFGWQMQQIGVEPGFVYIVVKYVKAYMARFSNLSGSNLSMLTHPYLGPICKLQVQIIPILRDFFI